MAPEASKERSVFLSTLPPSERDRRLARSMVVAAWVIFLAIAPFARTRLPEVWAFIPSYQSAMVVLDLITAALMLSQFGILRAPSLLVLAGGYLFTALMAGAHALSFPRLFGPAGLIGGGPQTTAWLYMVWHAGFPLAVIGYALLRDRPPLRHPGRAITVAILLVVVLVGVAVGLATAGHDLLPALMTGDRYAPALPAVIAAVWTLSLAALLVLWLRRPYSALDLWLIVVMWAWVFSVALAAVLNGGRFDLGFYAGRTYGMVAACLVLLVLLIETSALYASLASSFAAESAAREHQLGELQAELIHVARLSELGQMVSALAHEVKQPLTAVASYLRAGRNLLQSEDPAKAELALQRAADQVTRANDVIQRLQQFVRKAETERRAEDLSRAVEEVAALALLDTEGRATRLDLHFSPSLPAVLIDKVQVQQVLLNLIRNAVEAMAGSPLRDLAIRATGTPGGLVEVSVSDTGPGLAPNVRERLFQAFVTTKAAGMGVGLSICQSIVEAHGGRLWADDNPGGGTVFRFTLPVAEAETPASAGSS
jgi:two-component system sensor histidine kinase/response regulator